MFSPEPNGIAPDILEYLWRALRLSRKAIRLLIYLHGPQSLEGTIRKGSLSFLKDLPDPWKKEVPAKTPTFPAGPAPKNYLSYFEENYPQGLRNLYDPPWVLYHLGKVELLQYDGPRITVVGTRRASEYAKERTAQLVRALIPFRPLILSGMAWGIDGVAHQTALATGLPTLGVLGTPLERPYPPAHRSLFKRMSREGLLLSEIYPEATMAPWRFPERNRILAAMADAIVVVEAPEKSGALITAIEGLELGREIFVIPGPLCPPNNAGGHRLIQEGAHLLTHPKEIFEVLGRGPPKKAPGNQNQRAVQRSPGELSELSKEDAQIIKILRGGPLHVDKIIAISQKPAPKVLAQLMDLSLGGYLRENEGGYFELEQSFQ